VKLFTRGIRYFEELFDFFRADGEDTTRILINKLFLLLFSNTLFPLFLDLLRPSAKNCTQMKKEKGETVSCFSNRVAKICSCNLSPNIFWFYFRSGG